jgi:hypothetical protein
LSTLSLADPTLSLSAKSGLHLTLTGNLFFTFTDPLPDLAYLAGNPFLPYPIVILLLPY